MDPRAEPIPLLGTRRHIAQEALGTRQPAARGRIVAEGEAVLPGQLERDPGGSSELALSPEPGVRPLSLNDRATLVA